MNDTTTSPPPAVPESPAGRSASPLPPAGAPTPAPAPALQASPARFERSIAGAAALLLSFVTLVLLGLHWQTSRGTVDGLRLEVAKKLADADTLNKESRVVAEQAREASAEAQVKLGVL